MEAFILAAHRPFAHLQALNAGDDRALQVNIIVCMSFYFGMTKHVLFCGITITGLHDMTIEIGHWNLHVIASIIHFHKVFKVSNHLAFSTPPIFVSTPSRQYKMW